MPCVPVDTFGPTLFADVDGLVRFEWTYFTQDEPAFDPSGFFIEGVNGARISRLLSDIGRNRDTLQFGDERFAVGRGDRYGFFVHAVDKGFGAATLLVTNLRLVPGGTAVDGPPSVLLTGLGMAAVAFVRLTGRSCRRFDEGAPAVLVRDPLGASA